MKSAKVESRADEPKLVEVQLVQVVDLAAGMAQAEIKRRARLLKHYRAAPRVRADAGRLGQLFLNLLVNAAQAIEPGNVDGNTIRLTVSTVGSDAVVELSDDGSGMPAEVLERIFDPFFTTKPSGEGTGLGLPLVKSLAELHGGGMELTSELGVGTTATIWCPGERLVAELESENG